MRISDGSSDVCSSDLSGANARRGSVDNAMTKEDRTFPTRTNVPNSYPATTPVVAPRRKPAIAAWVVAHRCSQRVPSSIHRHRVSATSGGLLTRTGRMSHPDATSHATRVTTRTATRRSIRRHTENQLDESTPDVDWREAPAVCISASLSAALVRSAVFSSVCSPTVLLLSIAAFFLLSSNRL